MEIKYRNAEEAVMNEVDQLLNDDGFVWGVEGRRWGPWLRDRCTELAVTHNVRTIRTFPTGGGIASRRLQL